MTLTTRDFIRNFNGLKKLEVYKNRENQDVVLDMWYEKEFIQITLNNLKRNSDRLLAQVDLTQQNKYVIKNIKNTAMPNDVLKELYGLVLDLAQTPMEQRGEIWR